MTYMSHHLIISWGYVILDCWTNLFQFDCMIYAPFTLSTYMYIEYNHLLKKMHPKLRAQRKTTVTPVLQSYCSLALRHRNYFASFVLCCVLLFGAEHIYPDLMGDLTHWGQNGHHYPDDILKCIFLNKKVRISIEISLNFVPKGPIKNIIQHWFRSETNVCYDVTLITCSLLNVWRTTEWVNRDIKCW